MKIKSLTLISLLVASIAYGEDALKPIPFVVVCNASLDGSLGHVSNVGTTVSRDSIGFSDGDYVHIKGKARSYIIEDAAEYSYLETKKPKNAGSVLRISICSSGNYCRDEGTTLVSEEYILNNLKDANVTLESKEASIKIHCKGIEANNFNDVISFVKSAGLNY